VVGRLSASLEHDIANVSAQIEDVPVSTCICSGTSGTLTGAAVAVTVCTSPNIKL